MQKCPNCESIPEPDRPKIPPKVNKKLHFCQNRKAIGEFHNVKFKRIMDNYRIHLFAFIMLGKDYCIKWRMAAYAMVIGSILCIRDYTDRCPLVFHNEAQSAGMSHQHTIGIEGIAHWYLGLDGVQQLNFCSYISDSSVQDASTSNQNTVEFITYLQQKKNLLPRGTDANFYQQSDGCAKQYRSARSVMFYILLANRFLINCNIMITAPGHGKDMVDSLTGVDKRFLEGKFNKAGRGFEEKAFDIDNTTIMVDDTIVKSAQACADALNDPARAAASKRRKKREGQNFVSERTYVALDHSLEERLLKDTEFVIESGMPKKWITDPVSGRQVQEPGNGLSNMYHIYTCSKIAEPNCAAVRRYPCACPPCAAQIIMEWDNSIKDWRKQPRFINTPDCYARPIFEDLNDWNFITIAAKIPVKNKASKALKTRVYEDEMQACYDHVLHDYESRAILGCKPNTDSNRRQFGAIDAEVNDDCQDGYYLVEWTGDAFMLQEPWDVEGCVDQMPAGTWVIEGRYLD